MKSIKRINLNGSARKVQALLGPSTRALSPRGIRVALLAAVVLVGMALWSTPADGQEAAEPVWSADMTAVEYSSVSRGAASADLFSNVGGSGNLQIKSLWSHIPGRDLRLAFQEGVPNAADYTLQVGGLSLEFPEDSSGASSFKWNDVDVRWEDGQVIHVRIVPTSEIEAQEANTPATGVPTVSGTAQVGETLTAETSGIADADGLTNVSYAYQWIRTDGGTDAGIAGATDSTYTLTDDDQGKTIKLKVTFNDDKGNSETLAIVAASDVGESEQKPQLLVSNLGVNVETGIMRPLSAARSGFAQAFTTGAKTGGYALGSVGIQVAQFSDGSAVGDHLQVTINGVASEGEPGDAHCTLTNPSSFSAPGVIAFEAPAGAGSCPQLATETTYFVVIEWLNPSGSGSFALIPQTYSTEETAATEEDPGGAEGWSIADQSHYLAVSSDARTWTAYDETASFKIQVKEGAPTAARANTAPTGLPTISGTPQVDETLTADTSAISDEDGLDDVSFSYQWIVNDGTEDADIEDATDSTYTPSVSDVGKTIKVKVSFNDDADNDETLTSAATEAVAAKPNSEPTGLPAISGTPQVDETLTTDTSAISDEDGLDDVSYRYQWVRSDNGADTDIAGETDSTYTLVLADLGKTIKVQVTFTDDAENEETLTSEATEAVAAAPNREATGAPTISGTPQVGEMLTADVSGIDDADGLTNVAYRYQWIAGDTQIEDASDSTYTPSPSDVGKTIKVKVSFSDDVGNDETLTSQASKAVLATVPTEPLSLTVATGDQIQELDASWQAPSSNGGSAVTGYKVQWKEAADSWDTEADVSEASETGTAHTITDLTGGVEYAVRVIATNDVGDGPASTEAKGTPAGGVSEQVVEPENSAPNGLPSISGTPQVDQTLTADVSPIDDDDGLTNVSYRYQWIGDGFEISGATSSTLLLTGTQLSQTIQVRVEFTDDSGNYESLTSAATETVAAKPTPLTASFANVPADHDGSNFTFDLTFSENVEAGYVRMRDQAFAVTGGTIASATRKTQGSNQGWTMEVDPTGNSSVSITLPETTDCDASGAICTDDSRKLSHPTSATVAGPPAVSVSDATVQEAQGAVLEFTVTLGHPSSRTVTVDYATSDGSAQAGSDYAATSATLTFNAGDTSQTIEVAVLTDSDDEGQETLTLTLSNPSQATLDDATGAGTIENGESSSETEEDPPAENPPAETPVVLLTASFANMPTTHNGTAFTFDLTFSENVKAGYARIRDHAFTVSGGDITSAVRKEQGSNQGWTITVQPDDNGAVSITLPDTTDCTDTGAICTYDERELSHTNVAAINGPG